jgi:dihydrofolate synthase/folylpolyglutamate synthase
VAPNRRDVPTLAPVIDTLALLADPQDDYPTIHVTGTNGKGSTTTLAGALLGASRA